MDLLINLDVNRFLQGKTKNLLASALLLGACAAHQPSHTTPPLLQHAGPAVQIADVDMLALSPAMEAFLDRYILPYSNPGTRLHLLTLAVTSGGVLGFDYDESKTLTASEAFASRSGNCIGFANMMVALARRAGLKAHYQEVLLQPEWANLEDTVLVIKHINVVLKGGRYSYIVDVSGVETKATDGRRIILDHDASALYYNNIGVEALLENELPTAYAYLVKAIDAAPDVTDPWINLGVTFGRNEQLEEAALAQLAALQIDSNAYSAMSNLYEVYLAQEDLEAAEQLQAKVDRHRQKNPYYLMKLGEEAREQARFVESTRLLQRALKKKEDDHQLHFALAKTQYLAGETEAAQSSLQRAWELAPQDMQELYSRPLQELIAK